MFKYVLLASLLFFGFGCQTIKQTNKKSKPLAMKGWKKVDKKWFSQYAALKPAQTKRTLSQVDNDIRNIDIFKCFCSMYVYGDNRKDQSVRDTVVQLAGYDSELIHQAMEKCALDMFETAVDFAIQCAQKPYSGCDSDFGKTIEKNIDIVLHSCVTQSARVRYKERF